MSHFTSTDYQDIFSAVKNGDFNRVVYLVEVQRVSLQQHDDWDSQPLYYASLCGNEQLIKYLLSKGATCEEKTFDGERCLYAALHDGVRSLLLDKGFKRAGARRHDLYLEFLEKLYNNEDSFPDISFLLDGLTVHAHRFLLAARCPTLGRLINERWGAGGLVANPGRLDHTALRALLNWCYSCRLEVPVGAKMACQQLCCALKLHQLADDLAYDDTDLTGDESALAVIEPEREQAKEELQAAFLRTADLCSTSTSTTTDHSIHHDLEIQVGERSILAHRAMLCGRSEYFAVMLNNPNFLEGKSSGQQVAQRGSQEAGNLPLRLRLEDADPYVVQAALRWVYTDLVNADLGAETLLELMHFADRMLAEGLKSRCGVLLQPHVTPTTALFLLEEAISMDVDRLADACLRSIAQNLQAVAGEPRFAALVQESAAMVENREETDSVPLIDDLRYHISVLFGDGELSDEEEDWDEDNLVGSGIHVDFELLSERRQRLYLLDELLAELGIDA